MLNEALVTNEALKMSGNLMIYEAIKMNGALTKNEALTKELVQAKGNVYDPGVQMDTYAGEGDSMPVTRMMTPEQIKELQKLGFELDCPNVAGMACGLKRRAPAPTTLPPPRPRPAALAEDGS